MTGMVLIPAGGPSLADLAFPFLAAVGALLLVFMMGYLLGSLRGKEMKAITVLILVALSGCSTADNYLGRTVASYEMMEAGPKILWDSTKNHQGFKATIGLSAGKVVSLSIETTSSTPESATAAALETNKKLVDLLQQSIATGQSIATKGGSNVSQISPIPNLGSGVVTPNQ